MQDITVADILAAAGLSRANFYHYFASKYDVLAALVSNIALMVAILLWRPQGVYPVTNR